MKAAIIIMVIGIVLIVDSIREWNRNIKRIRQLEQRLTQYYKEREKRLKDKELIKRGPEWPE
jgi:Cys-tRNA synthase (O-phospho-L-seryl-tRNA:Cys-tRNA synthase)